MFAFSSWFFLFFPIFSWFSLFLVFFSLSRRALWPPCPPLATLLIYYQHMHFRPWKKKHFNRRWIKKNIKKIGVQVDPLLMHVSVNKLCNSVIKTSPTHMHNRAFRELLVIIMQIATIKMLIRSALQMSFRMKRLDCWKHSRHQGNLKGESVVAAILLSHLEVSYWTSGFF